jgi:outer membrane protein
MKRKRYAQLTFSIGHLPVPRWAVSAAVATLGFVAAAGVSPASRAQGPDTGLRLLDAVRMTLTHDPNISLVRSRVESSRGALLAATGQFDPLVALDASRAETASSGDFGNRVAVSSTVGLFQLVPTGLSLAPEVELARTEDGGAAADNQATVSFALRQPLLRGRGRSVVAAATRSAAEELEASRLDLQHAVSTRLAAVVSQYWTVAAAALDLEVLQTTEESSRALLATTRRLIAADVTPAAEAVQIEADVVAREANRIAAEQALYAARQALGREIGLEAAETVSLPLPSDPFPQIDPEAVPEPERDGLELTREALARRADLRAARRRLAAAQTLLAAARNALRPQLDLLFTPSYSGRVTGDGVGDFFSPVFQDVPGLSTLLGISLSWPLRNRQAEGALIQTQANVDQAALEVDLIAKGIGAETLTALDTVGSSALQVERAAQAIDLFEVAVENEEKKLQAGTSTLIDLISQRDRLTAARQRWVRAQLVLALALVDLRFQTGTLVTSRGGTETFDLTDVTTLPSFDRP